MKWSKICPEKIWSILQLRGKSIFALNRKFIWFILIVTGVVVFLSYLYFLFLPWNPPERSQQIVVTIKRGMTPNMIATLLKEKGVIRGEEYFLWGAKLIGVTRELQAGNYFFKGPLTNYDVLRKLSKGDVMTTRITFPEGTRASKMAGMVQEALGVDSTGFMDLVLDSSFCQSIGISADQLEGYLYPDTYVFHLEPTPEEIIQKMVDRFHQMFTDSLRRRADEIGMSVHEVVTLASIVEGEAAIASERAVIGALYLNRLAHRMLLQADPTIQYIIENGPRRLLDADLQIDSPYNTYIYAGLPPGPVNNPGIQCILAVLFPEPVDYLYMVANGDGSHTFSYTMEEHLKAKQRFDRIRQEVNRNH
ncbi:endolytic transglycosylase MltG [bacterium]|nr:endolytic transglycosylase MltG [bacterium]RQV95309.1 MAG: endolytic transglycosylase MltG [bacterium]